jgi:apolipoprotein N-acyltransferase
METKSTSSKHPALFLALGAALVFGANLRWGVGVLAWLAPAALLRYLRLTSGWRSRVAFAGALSLAWIAATFKIVTAPLPAAFALLGVGFAMFHLVGYLGADAIRRRAGEAWGLVAFPALMAVVEGVQHRCTELASWTAAAYTQLDDLPLLQLASVTGIAGIGILVHGFAAALESALRHDGAPGLRASRRWLGAAAGAVVAAHVFGAVRLAKPVASGSGDMTRVAAIGTDATFDGRVMPTEAERARTIEGLFADTRAAARAGAKLAVWTEGSALVIPGEEAATIEAIRELARSERLDVVAAYVIPLRAEGPVQFENKYVWVRADGVLDHTYFKHHPAPGEPALVGTAPLSAVEGTYGRAGGALCYDYDFPSLARRHGALGVDLVALPSSDWRGIDPIHTQMAALRAIEDGVSIVRSTRFGLSAGIDPQGRIRAQRSSFESDERVLVIDLPRHGIRTPYRAIGDVLVYASAAFMLVALAYILAATRAEAPNSPLRLSVGATAGRTEVDR